MSEGLLRRKRNVQGSDTTDDANRTAAENINKKMREIASSLTRKKINYIQEFRRAYFLIRRHEDFLQQFFPEDQSTYFEG